MTTSEHRLELSSLERFEAEWLQEKVDRLLAANGHSNPLKRGCWKVHPLGQTVFLDWLKPL